MKKMYVFGLALLLVAMTTSVFAQGMCGDKDVQVKVIKKQMGTECCAMGMEGCSCGMGQACQCSQGMGMGMCHKGLGGCAENFYLCCAKELALTEDQVKGLKAIQMGVRKSAIRNQADLQIMGMELDEMLGQPSPDRAAIDAKMTAIGELKTRIEREQVLAQLDARLVLSKEQLGRCRQGQCGCTGMMKWMEKECDMEKRACPSKDGKCSGKCSEDGKK